MTNEYIQSTFKIRKLESEEDDGEMTRLLYFDLADYKNSMQD